MSSPKFCNSSQIKPNIYESLNFSDLCNNNKNCCNSCDQKDKAILDLKRKLMEKCKENQFLQGKLFISNTNFEKRRSHSDCKENQSSYPFKLASNPISQAF